MSTYVESDYARSLQRRIVWDKTRSKAAAMLAKGYRKTQVAEAVGVDRSTIYNWLDDPEFAEEVDRLSLMTGVASRAERVRIAMRVVRQSINEEGLIATDKDVLDWLKFAQSETHGAKIDLSRLADLFTGDQGDTRLPSQHAVAAIDVGDGDGDGPLDQAADTTADLDQHPPTT